MKDESSEQAFSQSPDTFISIHCLNDNWPGLNYSCSKKKCCKKYKKPGKKRCKKCPERN